MTNECHTTDLVGLRKLRLWHWKQFKLFDGQAKKSHNSGKAEKYTTSRANATFHLRAVQTLNSLFPIDDTAEKDSK